VQGNISIPQSRTGATETLMLMAIVNLSGSLGAWHLELWWRREKDGEAIKA